MSVVSSTEDDSVAKAAVSERTVTVAAGDLNVVEVGKGDGPPILFVHGWPQTALAWHQVMRLAGVAGFRAVALDLPGVGQSQAASKDGTTDAVAAVINDLVRALELPGFTLVGHDLGGMAAYAYLRNYDGAARAVIMDTVAPGVAPWETVLANPYVWHFAFHSIPDLPELLVQGKQRSHFDFFFNVLSPERSGVSEESRDAYAEAYAAEDAPAAVWSRLADFITETN